MNGIEMNTEYARREYINVQISELGNQECPKAAWRVYDRVPCIVQNIHIENGLE